MEIGDWRLEIGDWRLEIGDWRLDRGGEAGDMDVDTKMGELIAAMPGVIIKGKTKPLVACMGMSCPCFPRQLTIR